ncbi:hypothetical protein [Fimbriiglobus ruber]|uniref:Uncharacterized protein n=1 Tax=Fimbriiglobus ruber TaxID=1908690 RepID=A0A225DIE4_9BACT|nr:hypothetical protein [Fimbriiglobus ruber]OWK39464.1 hypothetical protein FRUB_06027 [Fimbriiglobus ruber]
MLYGALAESILGLGCVGFFVLAIGAVWLLEKAFSSPTVQKGGIDILGGFLKKL